LTAAEQARIDAAVAAVNDLLVPYAVHVIEVGDRDAANVILDMNTTTAAGGYAAGVLGAEMPGQITLVFGWNWYTGSDAAAVGSGQYDLETAVVHELGHSLGLGHSSDPNSVMYATLTTGVSRRALTTADLHIPDADGGPDALHAALPVEDSHVDVVPAPETGPTAILVLAPKSELPAATLVSREAVSIIPAEEPTGAGFSAVGPRQRAAVTESARTEVVSPTEPARTEHGAAGMIPSPARLAVLSTVTTAELFGEGSTAPSLAASSSYDGDGRREMPERRTAVPPVSLQGVRARGTVPGHDDSGLGSTPTAADVDQFFRRFELNRLGILGLPLLSWFLTDGSRADGEPADETGGGKKKQVRRER
jgi:hypothetical protein